MSLFLGACSLIKDNKEQETFLLQPTVEVTFQSGLKDTITFDPKKNGADFYFKEQSASNTVSLVYNNNEVVAYYVAAYEILRIDTVYNRN